MATATIEIQVDVPDDVAIGEYERVAEGHAFHVSWDFPAVCRCETCRRESPLHLIEKSKFMVIRDLEVWGQPSFFVYQDVMHRCPCGHRQALVPAFKRKDVKYTYRFEQWVLASLIGSTAADVEQRLGIAAETVERIVRNQIEDAKAKKIDPQRRIERLGLDEISIRKGHKGYVSILTDLTDPSKPEVLAVAKGRDEDAGHACLLALSAEQRLAVRWHHTDMGAAYLAACAALLPNSQSVIDRFHVAQKLGDVADELRKKTTALTGVACPDSSVSSCVP